MSGKKYIDPNPVAWVSIEDELPPVVEKFNDGTNYHGMFEAWWPQFHSKNCRPTALFTSDSTEPRWLADGRQIGREPNYWKPTHWRSVPEAP